jgi:hypothetical protein
LRLFCVQSVIFEFLLAPGSRKETAIVAFGLNVNLEYPRYLGFMKLHSIDVIVRAAQAPGL